MTDTVKIELRFIDGEKRYADAIFGEMDTPTDTLPLDDLDVDELTVTVVRIDDTLMATIGNPRSYEVDL